MQQKKRAKKKIVREYSPESLMFRSVAGIVLIALGLLSLLSVVAGLRGAAFDAVRGMLQGLGGILCLGIPVFLLWSGILLAFSARKSMPWRGMVLMLLLYCCILGIFNLLSKIGELSFMEYVVRYNREQTPPVTDPQGFASVLGGSFQVCRAFQSFGGALGTLTSWMLWTYVGTVGGVVILSLVCVLSVALFANFDFLGWWREMKAKTDARLEEREAERNKAEYDEELRRQQEAKANLPIPAYKRRGKNGEPLPQQATGQPAMPGGMVYPQINGMTASPMIPMTMMQNGYAQQPGGYGQMPAQPIQNVELYDETVVTPQEERPSWLKGGLGKRKSKAEPAVKAKTQQTFAPLDREGQKLAERLEEIGKRKAEIEKVLFPNGQVPAAQPTPQEEKSMKGKSVALVEEKQDKVAAYKRPATPPVTTTAQQNVPMSGKRLDVPELILPDTKKAQEAEHRKKEIPPYVYPTLDLLHMPVHHQQDTTSQDAEDAAKLEKTLESFGIPARVQRVTHGPSVTRFELGLVSSGINVKRIMSIADNIALEMAANGGVRIEIPIPGTNLFGIEIPNKEVISVSLAEVLVSPEMTQAKSPLTVALGRDIAGRPVICDLAKMPHLLIAGQTGSGKSVCINTIINSILFRSSPEDVRMIMIDPKVVELQCYNVVPHLLIPVVSDPHKAAGALAWAVAEMLDRYHKMQSKNVRELSAYNAKLTPEEEKLPRIVIIIDELADLMLACKKEVEESIIRLAQLARAAGIHMVVATQRPTVDVITGLIKANIPSRIAFAVSSSIDSRTILDMNGAEKLLGKGDMFYYPTGNSSPVRVQGCFLSDGETEQVVDYIGKHAHVEFDPNIIEAMNTEETPITGLDDMGDGGVDDKLQEAIEMVIADGQASISMLQRRMKIGYARAGRLIDDMTVRGIISKAAGSKPREILISREEYEKMKDSLLA